MLAVASVPGLPRSIYSFKIRYEGKIVRRCRVKVSRPRAAAQLINARNKTARGYARRWCGILCMRVPACPMRVRYFMLERQLQVCTANRLRAVQSQPRKSREF